MKCTLCDSSIESPEISGQTLIKKKLIPYYLCRKCYKDIPYNHTGKHRQQKNPRQDFWNSLVTKLKYSV